MYDLGDPVPLSITVKDATGTPADAGSVKLTITTPTTAYLIDPVASSGSGVYSYSFIPTEAGRHTYRWDATGVNASAYTDSFDVDEAAPTGIVSLAEAKAHLNMTSTANDEELRRYIDAATDFVEGKIGPVVRRTIVEKLRPQSGLLFTSGPIISLTSITDTYGYGTVYNVAGYLPDGSTIYPIATSPAICYPVTVTYVGGRAIVPALVRQAALDYIAWRWESQRGPSSGPFQGGADEFAVTAPATVPYRILQALEPYASPVVA